MHGRHALGRVLPIFVSLLALTITLVTAFAVAPGTTGVPAPAAVFNVTTTADGVDMVPGDGICADPSGACTLRAAIMEANATAAFDIINVPPGVYLLTLPGAGENGGAVGDLDILQPVDIIGAGPGATIIDAGGAAGIGDRVLHVGPAVPASFSVKVVGVTIANGAPPNGADGGGIHNAVDLTVETAEVVNNVVTNARGGGIYNEGVLTVLVSVVQMNQATNGNGGGLFNDDLAGPSQVMHTQFFGNNAGFDGGAIQNRGPLTVTGSLIADNQATNGGGIANIMTQAGADTLAIVDSEVSGNAAAADGGGIWNFDGTLKVVATTLALNNAQQGGGFANLSTGAPTNPQIDNSTFSENIAVLNGGAIYTFNTTAPGGDPHLTHVTLYANQDAGGAGGIMAFGAFANIVYANTFISNPTGNCMAALGALLTPLNPNLDSDGTCFASLMSPEALGPLQLNGGPTPTRALLPGSQALNSAGMANCLPVDQRYVARPQGSGCDIGAFELLGGVNVIYLTTDAADTAGGVAWTAADIVAYDQDLLSWTLHFNGATHFPSADIDAFLFYQSNRIVMSFAQPTAVPGVGTVDDSDLVLYNPTTGTFLWAFDGSDVGLDTDDEDVDAIAIVGGKLIVSTVGAFNVPGVSGEDEDFIQLSNATFGPNTSGTWSLYFDGSDVGLGNDANRDLNAAWYSTATNRLYLSPLGTFTLAGMNMQPNDIVYCGLASTGPATWCNPGGSGIYWKGGGAGLSANLNGVTLDAVGVMPEGWPEG